MALSLHFKDRKFSPGFDSIPKSIDLSFSYTELVFTGTSSKQVNFSCFQTQFPGSSLKVVSVR